MPAARSPAQIEASRRNGARSHGPVTADGKAKASRNALKHGLTAMHHLVLEDEAPSELEELTARLMAEVDPMTEIEARLARRLAIAFWKGERAERIEVALFDAAPKTRMNGYRSEEADPLTTFDLKRFNAVRGYQAQQGREISRCLKELRQLRKDALARARTNPRRRWKTNPGARPNPPTTTHCSTACRAISRATTRRETNPVLSWCGMVRGQPPPAGGGCAGSEIGTNPGCEPVAQRDPAPHSSEPERLDGSRPQTRWGQGMDRVVGVDISKARLDAFCLASGRRLAVGNDAAGVAELAAWLEPGSLVVMEASGGYERLVHRLLVERGIKAAVVNALRVRQFAKAAGLLAKTDRLDAAVIARYGAFAKPAPTPVRAGAREALAETLAYRRQLLAEITARTQQLGHLRSPGLIERAQAALQRLRRDKAELDRLLQDTIAGDPSCRRKPRCSRARPAPGRCWSPPCWPSCPSWASSTGARSPAWSASPRSPGTAA